MTTRAEMISSDHGLRRGTADRSSRWLKELESRRGYNKACVAQANKTARIAWALLRHNTTYQVAA